MSAGTATAAPPAAANRGVALLLACAADAAAVAAWAGAVRPPRVDARGVLAVAAAPTRPVSKTNGWRGFVRCGDEWLSLALHTEAERNRLEAWLTTVGGQASADAGIVVGLPAGVLAERLQELGLAALPARPAHAASPVVAGARVPHDAWLEQPAPRPLAGLKVVDAGQLAAGPHAGTVLADLGADVTVVSHPIRVGARWHGGDAEHVDFNAPAGRRRFRELCARADIVVDNFRERVWENLALDPLDEGARVHLRLPAFPREDPRAWWKAFGFQTEALFGIGAGPPADAPAVVEAPRLALLDHAVGFAGVAAALRAVGRGGRVEVSHADLARAA